MKRLGLMLGVLLAVVARPAMAEEVEAGRIARACADDFVRLCAGRIPIPSIEDFQKGEHINQCLKEKLSQLSSPCWYVIMGGGSPTQ
jgi:hypothetical protein